MQFKNKKAIIFDMDGTLIDTMGSLAVIASRLIADNYKVSEEDARQLYLKTSGLPFFQQLEVLFPDNELNQKTSDLFEEMKIKKLRVDTIEMNPGDKEVLLKLLDKGYRLGISSGAREETVGRFAKNSGLPFTYALGHRRDFVKGRKHFNHIIIEEKGSAEDIIFVGDSLHDKEEAHKCGIDFIAKLGTFRREDFGDVVTIKYLRELLDIL